MRQPDEESDLPIGWVRARLGDLANYINGRGFKKSEWSTAGRPIIRIQNLTGSSQEYNRYQGEVDPKHLVPDGTLLVSWAATIDAYIYRGEEGALNQHIFKVEPFIDKWFLYYLVRYVVPGLMKRAQGSGIQHVRRGGFDNYPVSLPPLPEQRRIVDALEAAFADLDAGIAAIEAAQRDLDRYRRSVLKAAVEGALTTDWRRQHTDVEPAAALLDRVAEERRAQWEADQLAKYEAKSKTPPTNWCQPYKPPAEANTDGLPDLPKGWVWASLEQITSGDRLVQYGILKPGKDYPSGVPYVKVMNMRGDRIDVEGLRRTTPEIAAKYERASLAPGDILLSIRGTFGRIAEVPDVLDGANITQDSVRIAPASVVDRDFLATCLRAPMAQAFFHSVSKGAAVQGVNVGDVRLTPVPLPPMEEQAAITEAVEERLSVADAVAAALAQQRVRADRLRRAVLQRAFAGEFVPQNPTDEPASVLLERVLKELAERKNTTKHRKRTMSTPKPIPPASLAEIVKANGPTAPHDLWKRSGIKLIDAFYADLKNEVEAGSLAEQVLSPTKRMVVLT